ncbi:hypothetical protein AMEJIAPC_03179 [Caulobacter sp. NIBR1757]|nr:hypothetical protein AMEJIAPC_03179 [Caulobacter sp. NIBR1757]
MFGQTRKRRFERAVLEEIAYMVDLHGPTPDAVKAAQARAARPNLNSSRVRVIEEAASRLAARMSNATGPRSVSGNDGTEG